MSSKNPSDSCGNLCTKLPSHRPKPHSKLPVTSSRPPKTAINRTISSDAFKHTLPLPSSLAPRVDISSIAVASKTKRLFSKEIRCMLFGFGDDQNPYTETVDMIEDLVLHFISDIAIRALNFGASDRISIEDLMCILRKDPKKYSRLKDLLDMNQELRQARKAFDEIKYIEQ